VRCNVKNRIIGLLLLLAVVSISAHAQFTVVSGQVTDQTGVPYAGCHGSASFIPSPSATQQPTLSGSSFQTSLVLNQCDSLGNFTITLADNNSVTDGHTPGGQASQWRFDITSADNRTSFGANVTVTGATQNITTSLRAASVLLPATITSLQTRLGSAFPSTLGMKLRKLAANAQVNNPLINTPLGPAPAWASGTIYIIGQVVVNGGYQYICSVAGTSAGSGGPTGQGFAPITDNTVTWLYYGYSIPASAAANQPVISQSASVPGALTQTIAMNVSPSPFYFTGGIPFVNGSGTYGFYSLLTTGSTKGGPYAAVTFVTDANEVAIKVTGGTQVVRYIIDGQYVTISGYKNGSGASPSYNLIDFTNAGGRKARTITMGLFASNVAFGGISIAPTEEAWAPPVKDNVRVLWIGDSISSGGNGSPVIADADTPRQVGQYLGWSDVWDSSQGGVGYTAQNGGSNYTFGQTVTNMVPGNAPDLVVFMGSVNDVGTASATQQSNVLTALGNVRSAYAYVPIIVLGIWSGATGPSVGLKSTETDIQTAVATFSDANTYFIPIATDPVQAWMTGTGKNTSTTGVGNSDAYTSSDGTHPSDIGRLYEARREATAILNVIQQIP
jgi:lysophospholipase L1-like esterase